MNWQYSYIAVLFLAVIISLAIAIYAWLRRDHPAVFWFAGMMLAIAEYVLTSGLISLSNTPQQARFWVNPHYFGLTMMVALFITFAITYTGRGKWLTKTKQIVIFSIPFITQLVIETNNSHHWFIKDIQFEPDGILMGLSHIEYGWFFGLHSIYSYALVLIGIGLILQKSIRTFRLYQQQSIVLILGILPPLLASLNDSRLFGFGFAYPLVPLGFALLGMALAWALFRYQMLNIVPMARDTLFEKLNENIIVLDTRGNIVDCNPAAEKLLGIDLSKTIGQPAELVLASWDKGFERYWNQPITQTEISLTRDQQVQDYELRISPLKDRRGQIGGRIIVLRDITEQKKLQAQAIALTLEKERTRILNQFVQNASHELRSPLTIINTDLYLMTKATDGEKRELLAKRSRDQIMRLTQLLDMILYMTKLDSEASFSLQIVDVNDLIQIVIAKTQTAVAPKGVNLSFNPDIFLPKLNLDITWMEQALQQLLNNAIQFAPKDGSIEIYTCVQDDHVIIEITDNGSGIDDQARPHIFKRFWRQDEAHTTPGFGLGLPIAQKIIANHGGTIEVDSTPGIGSTFMIKLPF